VRLGTFASAFVFMIAGTSSAMIAQSASGKPAPKVTLGAQATRQRERPELLRRWQALQLEVGHAGVVWPLYFVSSLNYWRSGELDVTHKWSIDHDGDLNARHAFKEESSVLIKGDCRADIGLAKGGLVHIYGNLANTIDFHGNGEIVIGGAILPGAAIKCDDGIQAVFVGGDVQGVVSTKGMLKIAICGSLVGTIETGDPSAEVHVHGNLTGKLKAPKSGGLLFLEVGGYMPYATIEALCRDKYIDFRADIATSDHPSGIYPQRADERRITNFETHCWTIHRRK
jgi:hypothetical protein